MTEPVVTELILHPMPDGLCFNTLLWNVLPSRVSPIHPSYSNSVCTKHRLATCDGSAPHGAMSMSMGGAGPRGYQQVFIHNLHPCFRRRWLLQVCLGKAFLQKHAFVDISVFLWLRKQQPRFAQGQPKCYDQIWKNLIEKLYTGIAGVNGRWGQVVEETACCHSAPGETWKVTLDNWQCGAYLSTIFAWVQSSVLICANLIMSWKLSDLF